MQFFINLILNLIDFCLYYGNTPFTDIITRFIRPLDCALAHHHSFIRIPISTFRPACGK